MTKQRGQIAHQKNKKQKNKNRSFYALEMIRNIENDVIANESNVFQITGSKAVFFIALVSA